MHEYIVTTALILLVVYKYLSLNTHLMMLLLTLELSMMSTFLILTTFPSLSPLAPSYLMYFFVLNVMEASLGLSMIVFMSRTFDDETHTDF